VAARLGAVSSLQKPFKPFELLAAVTDSLSNSSTRSGETERRESSREINPHRPDAPIQWMLQQARRQNALDS